ncbi:MAG: hypothetical protein WDN69_32100 [Aliidongia sp.]
MLRNLGGAIGTASLQTIITKREQFHSNIIGQSVTPFAKRCASAWPRRPATSCRMAPIRASPEHQALVQIGQVIRRQALVMGFGDTFAVIGVMLAIAAVSLLLARKPRASASAASAH